MAVEAGYMDSRAKELFVAQQLHFANTLAGNDADIRSKAIKRVRNYFIARANGVSCFTHDDFLRLWKGFFYCMWICDRPLIQEELAERISELTHCFEQGETALAFIKAHFNTVLNEWYAVDYSRLDKFKMLVRRFLRQCFVYCKKKNWSESIVCGLREVFEHTILSPSKVCEELVDPRLIIRFVRVFVEELAEVGDKELPQRVTLEFLKPFCDCMVEFGDRDLFYTIREEIFYSLMKQSSLGLEYEEKFAAWKAAGFPGNSWKRMVIKRIENNEDCSDVKLQCQDPRRAKVHVYVPNIDFDARSIAKLLKDYVEKSHHEQCKTQIRKLIRNFQALANGNYPFAQKISKTFKKYYRSKLSKRTCEDAVDNSFDKEHARKTNKERIIKKENNAASEEIVSKPKKKSLNKKSSIDQRGNVNVKEEPQSLGLATNKINETSFRLDEGYKTYEKNGMYSTTIKEEDVKTDFVKNEIFDEAITDSKITVSRPPLRRSPRLLSKALAKKKIVGDKAITDRKITVSQAPLRRSPRLLMKKQTSTLGQHSPANNKLILDSTPASSKKKVNRALKMNSSQGVSEYIDSLKENPSVPHDANKKLNKGVLKKPLMHRPIKPPKRVRFLLEEK